MKTLDRYILRNFLFTLVLFFVAGLLLRVVADLFINFDEFAEKGGSFRETMVLIGTYYGHQSAAYFAELGGVLIVASAVFTLAMMNKTNELTAMLAAGVSLHRVLLPILICSMLMGGLIMVDQEFIIPPLAPKLVLPHDDVPGTRSFPVRLMTDGSGAAWYSRRFVPTDGRMELPLILLRDKEYNAVAKITGTEARPGDLDGRPGWHVANGSLARISRPGRTWQTTPDSKRIYTRIDPVRLLAEAGQGPDGRLNVRNVGVDDPAYRLRIEAEYFEPDPPVEGQVRSGRLRRPRFTFSGEDDQTLGVFLATSAEYTTDEHGGYWSLNGGTLFYPSDLTTEDLVLRRSSNWLQFMSTGELTRLLRLRRVPDEETATLTRHLRFVEPINNVIMLLLGVPFILSRERNVKAAAALCLAMVVAFYAFVYFCRYVGLPPIWAAGLPIVLFGPVAVVMVDSIKT